MIMSLETPFGALNELDTSNMDELRRIAIAIDKTRMLEGMIIEQVFSGIIHHLSNYGVSRLPLSLLKALRVKETSPQGRKQFISSWWAWRHDPICPANARFVGHLSKAYEHVLSCHYDDERRDFLIDQFRQERNVSVQDLLKKYRKHAVRPFSALDENIVNLDRSEAAVWANIQSNFGNPESFFKNALLHRFFKNFALQPYFQSLWDIDNVVELNTGEFFQLEVKHKFPYNKKGAPLQFGINTGQIRCMQDLASRGINTLHIIMVKPVWDKNVGSGYLMNNFALRPHVYILAKLLDRETIQTLLGRQARGSGYGQSFTGTHNQKVRYLRASEFQCIGTLDDSSASLSNNLYSALKGKLSSPVTDDMLFRAKISEQY